MAAGAGLWRLCHGRSLPGLAAGSGFLVCAESVPSFLVRASLIKPWHNQRSQKGFEKETKVCENISQWVELGEGSHGLRGCQCFLRQRVSPCAKSVGNKLCHSLVPAGALLVRWSLLQPFCTVGPCRTRSRRWPILLLY